MGIFSWLVKSSTLYFPGCTTYFKEKEKFELYQKIFSKLGIHFRTIDIKVCCGLPALEGGYESEAWKLARANFEIFKREGVESIITNSPCCYKMFLFDYPGMLPDWDIKVKNIWEIILNNLEAKSYSIKKKVFETVGFHDSCYLGRYCGVFNEPRKILELIGYEINEMEDSRERSVCCGSCGGLPRVNPELADKIARQRILQAKRIGIKKLIVSSIDNYQLLKKNSVDSGIEISEFSEVLAFALGIKINEKELEEEIIEGENEIISAAKAGIKKEDKLKEEDYYDYRENRIT